MVRDWLHESEDTITPLASYLRQVALLVLSKIAKNLFSYFLYIMFLILASMDICLGIFPTLVLVNIV
jgi:hypothetical protein